MAGHKKWSEIKHKSDALNGDRLSQLLRLDMFNSKAPDDWLVSIRLSVGEWKQIEAALRAR